METQHDILVNSKRGVQFKLSINRKFTIIRGDSATGKTTLYQMIEDAASSYMSGVTISCDVPVKPIPFNNYVSELQNNKGMIYIADEDFEDILTKDFAALLNKSDNCFILITRHSLPGIPYSYKEIYEIKESGKYHFLQRMYPDYKMWVDCEKVVTEDEDAGLDYYEHYFHDKVITSKGNSNLSKYADENTLIVGDGSAIGPYIQDLLLTKAKLFLPESFEYLLLCSDLFENNKEVQALLEQPEKVISTEYNSWERFFTEFLMRITKGTPAQYSKSHLSKCYYENCCTFGNRCEFFTRKNKKNF